MGSQRRGIADIKDALEKCNPSAAEEFVKLYLYSAGNETT